MDRRTRYSPEVRERAVGKPDTIGVDNAPEYLSQVFVSRCWDQAIRLNCIQPGKPIQNA